MKTTNPMLGILRLPAGAISPLALVTAFLLFALVGCGNKSEVQPAQAQQAPAQAPAPEKSVKAAEVAPPVVIDENATIHLGNPVSGDFTLAEINKKILSGELSPTNTYYEFPKEQPVGVNVTGEEKPLSSLKGIVKLVASGVVAAAVKSDGQDMYVIGTDTGSREELWRAKLTTPQEVEVYKLHAQVHVFAQPKVAVAVVSANLRLSDSDGYVLGIDLASGKELWTNSFKTYCDLHPLSVEFVEPKYVLVRDSKGILGFDVSKGSQIWSINWEKASLGNLTARRGLADFKGADADYAYIGFGALPVFYAVQLAEGSLKPVVQLPSNWRVLNATDEGSGGEMSPPSKDQPGAFEAFFVKPQGSGPVMAVDERETGLQLFSLPDGKLSWKKDHKDLFRSALDEAVRKDPAELSHFEMGFPMEVTTNGPDLLLRYCGYEAVVSARTGETISCRTIPQ